MKLKTFSRFAIYIIGCISIISCSSQNNGAIETDSSSENIGAISIIEKETTNKNIVADLKDLSYFNRNSYNDIYIGDKFDDTLLKKDTEIIDDCFNAVSNTDKKEANYQIENGLVATIYTNELGVESYSGVKIGNTLEDVYSKHTNETPEVINNPYGESGKNLVLIYWYSSNEDGGIRYDIDDNHVTSISIGNSSLVYMEGCL